MTKTIQTLVSIGKRALFGSLAMMALSTVAGDADAATVHRYGRYYICDMEFSNTYTRVDLYYDYGCQGGYVGTYLLVGPGKTAKNTWGASRFDSMSKWLADNRWTALYFSYDDADNSIWYIGPRG